MKTKFFILLACLCFCLLYSCRSLKGSQYKVANDPLTPKLPSLEKKIEDFSNTNFRTEKDLVTIFTNEIDNNLTDMYSEKYGSISISARIVKYKLAFGGCFFNIFFLNIPGLLGSPYTSDKYVLEVGIKIFDSQQKLLYKRTDIGRGKAYSALYWGYSGKDATSKAYTDALKMALNKIRTDIKKESSKIIEQLKTSGPSK